jgi:hypothetical protein
MLVRMPLHSTIWDATLLEISAPVILAINRAKPVTGFPPEVGRSWSAASATDGGSDPVGAGLAVVPATLKSARLPGAAGVGVVEGEIPAPSPFMGVVSVVLVVAVVISEKQYIGSCVVL